MRRLLVLFMTAVLLCAITACAKKGAGGAEQVKGKTGVITFQFDIKNVDGDVPKTSALYVPYPASEESQDISKIKIDGNFSSQTVKKDDENRASYIYATWENPNDAPKLTFEFTVDSHFKKGSPLKDGGNTIPSDVQPYLAASEYMPCDNGQIVELAQTATANAVTILEKARAVYEWTIQNTVRNPDTIGCGLGLPLVTLNENSGGGKCADISSVFVTMLRAAGVPAREVYGLRIGGKDGEVTGDFHCWAEFYLPGTGWVQADPADVRKAMLVNNLELEDAATKDSTEFFWNGDDLFRIILSRADYGILLNPLQNGTALEYFMYPFGVADGTVLNYFDYKSFSYSVSFKKDK
ncbi:MAG: transglutaminase family protein [Termitinemataceae bacterium]|nr:MAG: transglutaminase family protein [Termitinemataceae bacterium]